MPVTEWSASYSRRHDQAPLFFGMGNNSMLLAYDLERRLRDAFNNMSGMQQPIHPDHDLSAEEQAEINRQMEQASHEIEETAKDIFAALTGHRVTATEAIHDWYKVSVQPDRAKR